QLGGNRRKGLRVPRERPQDRGVPAPFFQHLRGCLHEVPLGAHAGEASPARAPAEEVVEEVAELVEEGDYLAVLQELARPREVADQSRLRKLLPRLPGLQRELRRVLVFAFAREEIEVEAAHLAAFLEDVEASH